VARMRASGTDWEDHHDSLRQANPQRREPRPPDLTRIEDISAHRGLPPRDELDRLANNRRRIEPAAALRPRDWQPGSAEQGEGQGEGTVYDPDGEDESDLGEANQAATQQAIATSGIDAIAYYLPITFYGPSRYGIYIRERRYFGLCATIQKFAPHVDWDDVAELVLQFLLHHEGYHAAVELSCLTSDDYLERKTAETYREYFDLATGPWRLPIHRHGIFPYRCPEEQLAQHAGFSSLSGTPAADAVRSALIHVSTGGPSDYVYDDSEWSKAVTKGKQESLERALHRTQAASLLHQPLPTSIDDVQAHVEPRAWFPKGGARDVLQESYGLLPIYVVDFGRTLSLRFARACVLRNIPIRKFIKVVCKKFDAVHDPKGGKHPRIIFDKYKITYPRSAKITPDYVIEQFLDARKISEDDLKAAL
jgi:hypothetical protein